MSELSPGRRILGVLRFVAQQTFVEPVRRGHIGEEPEHPWAPGLRHIVHIAHGLYAVLCLLAFIGVRLRHTTGAIAGESLSLPLLIVLAIVPGIVLSGTLAFVGAMHWRHPLRFPMFLGVVVALFSPVPTWLADPMHGLVTAVLIVALVVLAIWRGRRRFAVWEVPVVALILTMGWIGAMMNFVRVSSVAADGGMAQLALSLNVLILLAMPAMLAAGAAITEIVVGVASWTARGVWEAAAPTRHGRTVAGVLIGALALWAIAADGVELDDAGISLSPGRMLLALIYVVVVAVTALAVLWLVPRGRRPGVPVDPDDISTDWSSTSLWLVLGFGATEVGPELISLGLIWFGLPGLPDFPGSVLHVPLGIVFAVAAIRSARRGHPERAVVFSAFASSLIITRAMVWSGNSFGVDAIPLVVDFIALILLAVLLITGRFTADRLLAVATVLLLTRLYAVRDWFDEPFTNLFALSGAAAALVVGLVWRQLTEYQIVRAGSRRFPVDSRVLVGLANMLLVGTSIVANATAGTSSLIDLAGVESQGDSEIGMVLYLAAACAGLLLAWRGREGGDERPGTRFRVDRDARIEPTVGTLPPPTGMVVDAEVSRKPER